MCTFTHPILSEQVRAHFYNISVCGKFELPASALKRPGDFLDRSEYLHNFIIQNNQEIIRNM